MEIAFINGILPEKPENPSQTTLDAMSVSEPSRATIFLATFNEIEQFLRSLVDGKRHINFPSLVAKARKLSLLSDEQAEDLRQFGTLRNAIAHGEYQNYRPIAEPLPETLSEIAHIRDVLLHPPIAVEILGHQNVITFSPEDHIHKALDVIRTTTISQFPIYQGDTYHALLTTNTIARWVAADLDDNDHLDARIIADVLRYAESNDRAGFIECSATAQQAIEALTVPRDNHPLPKALIVTDHGKPHQRPLRIIGGSDLSALLAATGQN